MILETMIAVSLVLNIALSIMVVGFAYCCFDLDKRYKERRQIKKDQDRRNLDRKKF